MKQTYRRTVLLSLVILLGGCSAAGVVHTNDPTRKLQQAYMLQSQGRPIPAERLAKQSIDLYEKKQDVFGQSEANFFLGNFYKFKSTWPNTDDNEFLSKALVRFNLSVKGFISVGEEIQASKAYFGLGQTHVGLSQKDLACDNFKKSYSLIKGGKGKDKLFKINNPEHGSAADIVKANVDEYCK